MTTQMDLRKIKRKAFLSTYQDGLLDILLGLIVAGMAIFDYRPASGYSPMNIVLSTLIITLAKGLFWAVKKYITLPRMGQVRFGEIRKRKARTPAVILSVFVLIQVGLVGFITLGWALPEVSAQLSDFLQDPDTNRMVVAAIGSLIVGTSMIVIAHFTAKNIPTVWRSAGWSSMKDFVIFHIFLPAG